MFIYIYIYTCNLLLQCNIRVHTHTHTHTLPLYNARMQWKSMEELFLTKGNDKKANFSLWHGDKVGEARPVHRIPT